MSQNPNAIGYASLASIKDSIKALTVNGVAPTEATVKDGTYLVQRPSVPCDSEGAALSETVQKFFDFATLRTLRPSSRGGRSPGGLSQTAYRRLRPAAVCIYTEVLI